MLIEIKDAGGVAYLVDPERLVVPRPGSRAARAWFERGPRSAADEAAPTAAAPLDGFTAREHAHVPLERLSPATARKAWLVISGGP